MGMFLSCKTTPVEEEPVVEEPVAVAPEPEQAPPPPPPEPKTPEEGIYVGIISFAADAYDLTGEPVFLDEAGRDKLLGVIDEDYNRAEEPGTALFYAVHKAIAGITANNNLYPSDILSANVVTFTDGLDTSSTFLRLPAVEGKRFGSDEEYQAYINEEITSRIVNNANITAFSSGVRSYDVVNSSLFTKSLESIASPGNADVLDNFEKLQGTFENIADQVEVTLTRMTGTLSVTGFPVGTVIRLTFDAPLKEDGNAPDLGAVDVSKSYVEGTLALNESGDGYVLNDIQYAGIVSSTGDSVPGTINGNVIDFVFENVVFVGGADPLEVLQWYKNPATGDAWLFNTEYLADQDIQFYIVKKSVVIYLVLDSSTSLSNSDVSSIREASKAFIQALYEKVE
jgi:hypothetical protein